MSDCNSIVSSHSSEYPCGKTGSSINTTVFFVSLFGKVWPGRYARLPVDIDLANLLENHNNLPYSYFDSDWQYATSFPPCFA